MPVNALIIRALLQYYLYYGESFQIECPTGSGDNGAGLGASHQTGWTGLVARLIQIYGVFDSRKLLEAGKKGAFGHRAAAR
jgi:hypothetical protein